MHKNVLFCLIVLACSLSLTITACAKPPKPGPDFVWVKKGKRPGHWKYTGPPASSKAWVKGHFNNNGKWIPGHWKKGAPPRPGAVWVPAHRTPNGKKVPGHWKK